jgi:hypothetical protein
MPRAKSTIPLECPRCEHSEAALFISSTTVMTAKCTRCAHTWMADTTVLPEYILRAVTAIVGVRRPYATH